MVDVGTGKRRTSIWASRSAAVTGSFFWPRVGRFFLRTAFFLTIELPTFLALEVECLASRHGEPAEKGLTQGQLACGPRRALVQPAEIRWQGQEPDQAGGPVRLSWFGLKRRKTKRDARAASISFEFFHKCSRQSPRNNCNQLQLHTVSRKRILRASSSGRAAATSDVVGAVQRCGRNAWGSLGPTAPRLPPSLRGAVEEPLYSVFAIARGCDKRAQSWEGESRHRQRAAERCDQPVWKRLHSFQRLSIQRIHCEPCPSHQPGGISARKLIALVSSVHKGYESNFKG